MFTCYLRLLSSCRAGVSGCNRELKSLRCSLSDQLHERLPDLNHLFNLGHFPHRFFLLKNLIAWHHYHFEHLLLRLKYKMLKIKSGTYAEYSRVSFPILWWSLWFPRVLSSARFVKSHVFYLSQDPLLSSVGKWIERQWSLFSENSIFWGNFLVL